MPEDRKKLYMWLSVGSITAVIALIWFASIKYNISTSLVEVAQSKQKGVEALANFGDNFKKQFEEISNSLNTTTSTAATSSVK